MSKNNININFSSHLRCLISDFSNINFLLLQEVREDICLFFQLTSSVEFFYKLDTQEFKKLIFIMSFLFKNLNFNYEKNTPDIHRKQ